MLYARLGLASILLLVPSGAASGAPDRLDADYFSEASWAGHFQGSCAATVLRHDAPASHPLSIQHSGATMVVLTTRWIPGESATGSSVPGPGDPVLERRRHARPLPAGTLTVSWDATGLGMWTLPGIPGEEPEIQSESFQVTLDATMVRSTAALPEPPEAAVFWHQGERGAVVQPRPVLGDVRYDFQRGFESHGAPLTVAGDVALYLRGATILAGERRVDVGPYERADELVPGALRHTEAFLVMDEVRATVSAPASLLQCRSLDYTFAGTWTADHASGTAMVDGRPVAFSDERIEMTGAWRASEVRVGQSSPQEVGTSTASEGQIDRLSVAGNVAAARPLPVLPLATGAAGLAVVAVLARYPGILAFFYARILGERVLRHPRRVRILETVQGRPGLSLSDLAASTSMPLGPLRHHLAVLQRASHIELMRHGRAVRVLPTGPGSQHARRRVLLEEDPRFAFLVESALLGAPQRRLEDDLSARFGFSVRAARKAIHSAERRGLVRRARTEFGIVVDSSQSPDGRAGTSVA